MFSSPILAPFFNTSLIDTPFSASNSLPRPDRPALLASATSWTADEDFSILLRALSLYDIAAQSSINALLPKIFMIITGKGAGKEAFEKEVVELEKEWQFVRIRTSWLAIEDYPRLLGSCKPRFRRSN